MNDTTTFIIASGVVANNNVTTTTTTTNASSAAASSSSLLNYLPIIDTTTGKAKIHYKVDDNKEISAMTSLENGDMLLCALKNKNTLISYAWGKESFHSRFASPEPLCTLTSNQFYVIGGGNTGEVYVWELGSGYLLKVWKAHYRPISKIVFCIDGVGFLTSGEDGNVMKWNLSTVLNVLSRDYSPKPDETFNLHKLPITDMELSYNSFFLITCSLDRSCKVCDVNNSKKQINTFVYPAGLTCLTVCGDFIACGSSNGVVYLQKNGFQMNNNDSISKNSFQLHGHSSSVTCIKKHPVLVDTIVSSSLDCTIRVWNAYSKQPIKTITLSTPIRSFVIINRFNDFNKKHGNSKDYFIDLKKYVSSSQEEIQRKISINKKRFYLHDNNSNNESFVLKEEEEEEEENVLLGKKQKMKTMLDNL